MRGEDIFSEFHGDFSESPAVVKKLEFSCAETQNVWGGIDLIPQILSAMEMKDPIVYQRMQSFYLALNLDGILTNRCSIVIWLDLFFRTEFFELNPFAVAGEIKSLEMHEISQTKKEKLFTGPVLGGLWHKHYMNGDVASLAHNIKMEEAKIADEKRYSTKEDLPKILNDIPTNNLSRRRNEGRMTGEWIIYVQHESQNFYLCLAKHKDGDEKIRERIERICILEFPFLKDVFKESPPGAHL